jgi:hypothetical protein
MHFQKTHGAPISTTDWLSVTVDQLNVYRLSDEYMFFNNSDGSASVPANTPAITQTKPSFEAFKKAIRRDPNQFKPFDDRRHWSRWQLGFEATARAQDLSELLDSKYCPALTGDAQAVFQAKQEYLFSVLVVVLNTDEGKALVRAAAKTSDAQSIRKYAGSAYS